MKLYTHIIINLHALVFQKAPINSDKKKKRKRSTSKYYIIMVHKT